MHTRVRVHFLWWSNQIWKQKSNDRRNTGR